MKIKINISTLIGLFLITACICGFPMEFYAQDEVESTEVVNDSKREEVQRYFGYELLLYRYLSLPYDVSMNINEHGSFVEIGFIFILFFPFLLLLMARRRLWLFVLLLIFFIFTWIISTSNSFLYSTSQGKIATTQAAIDQYLSDTSIQGEPVAHAMAYVTKLSLALYQPILAMGEAISGNRDSVTYPVILFGFVLVSLLLHYLTRNFKARQRNLLVLFWTYAFLWFAFSGGIVWYGYLLLFLGFFVLYQMIEIIATDTPVWGRWLKKSFIGLGLIWIILGYTNRLSNVQALTVPEEIGKGIFNPVFYEYGLGRINDQEVLNKIYPNVYTGINKINADPEALVWRVGTSFTYFINNNTERVVMDNQLGMFYELYTTYPNKQELAQVFMESGVRYIIVDYNTAQIDKTPQKTLTEKYRQLMLFLYNNPRIKLLATDRILQRTGQNNNIEYFYGDFGDLYQFGRYGIYEII